MTSSTQNHQVVLVTGASSGIGLATALALAARGAHLALVAREPVALQEAADACTAAGAASATALPLDVADGPAVARAVAAFEAEHGAVEVLVHSAGVAGYGRFEQIPEEVFEAVLRTNVLGMAAVVRTLLPGMRARGHGHLVLVGSLLGDVTVPMMTPYVMGKWAVKALARQLQQENRDVPGLAVTLVRPGGIDTPIYRTAAAFGGHHGRPPFPVYSPEAVATAILKAIDRPRRFVDVGFVNPVIRFGYYWLPAVYDAFIGLAFRFGALERKRTPATPGNVLAAQRPGHGLRGLHRGLSRRSR